ncbi:8-oxo-dGTP pyrophosphatase MutT (NUDIX family) [Lewinella marina]|uniref:Coenzyme A pyrophosphatase n=1 Tax=Neolewinella marina TaxID=438751 RepID=A0A2G0CEL9_9BACT|nr:CoA pyrophosphatase [Neolewinella marina]NJB87243.1 8-oxo-dGTP pyrophosphatase MutT (NUDIX family) [Neolewinella marina]PHK98431.1 coenzyme A pyrophosphatase [Neolewinella marina]
MNDTLDGADYLQRIRRRLQRGDLPGYAAQEMMGHALRKVHTEAPPTARPASVLALFYPVGLRLHLLFIQRTSPPGDRHGGQVSFPGGAAHPEDESPAATALRETREEVGVNPSAVQLLGELTPLYIPVSNYLVNPFVAWTPQRPDFTLQASEVERVLELPFTGFYAERAVDFRDKKLFNGMILKEVPHWVVAGEEVWGATAMMVGELVELGRG